MYRSTVFTFVNSHLAAFDEFTDKRNADYHDVVRRLTFYPNASFPDPGAQTDGTGIAEHAFQTDVLFWMVRTFVCA